MYSQSDPQAVKIEAYAYVSSTNINKGIRGNPWASGYFVSHLGGEVVEVGAIDAALGMSAPASLQDARRSQRSLRVSWNGRMDALLFLLLSITYHYCS